MEKLVTEKEKIRGLISNLEEEIETNASKESQLKELDSRKNELISYVRDVIKSIQREVSEKERTVNECKPCFAVSRNKKELQLENNKNQKDLVAIETELNDLEKKQVRLEEHEDLAERLELKDGKCPVCDSSVDHLNSLFQKEHIVNEIKVIQNQIEQLETERTKLIEKLEKLGDELEESKEAETILKTHKITDESQLEEIVADIKIKTKQIQKIPITVNSGQLVEAATLDSHAKTLYESIASLEKSTEGFDQEAFLKMKESLHDYRNELSQIDQEYGEISGNNKKISLKLEKLGTILKDLKHVHGYVGELEEIQNSVYNRDGPVGKSLRSWALEVISVKASEYLEKLNTKIQRISLSEKNTKIDITCYSRNTTLELESLSGGEQVSIALALRLGMAHLLGASNLNFMILDEPTTHLDSERRKSLVNVLSQLTNIKQNGSSMQFIIITHDAEIFDDSSVENIYKFEPSQNGTIVSAL